MKMKKKLLKKPFFDSKIVLVVFFFCLFMPAIAEAGFGISPGVIDIKEALRGTSFEKVFVISRSDPVNDILITVEPLGETAEWFQFERGLKFTYPAGERQSPVKAVVTVPSGTPNGIYKGKVRFQGSPQKVDSEGGSSVGIAMGALADITINVTDKEIKGFRVVGASVDKAIEGEDLIIALTIENTGNVDIQPDHVIIDLFDKFHKIQLASFTISKMEGVAKVQNIGRILIPVPWLIPEKGNYWAELSIFDNQGRLVSKENVPFDAKAGAGKAIISGTGNLTLYLIVGILGITLAVILILFIIFLTVSKNRQNKQLEQIIEKLSEEKERKGGKKKKIKKKNNK